MRKVWDLGNTTIRNPNRIELGLRVFANEFQGHIHGQEDEKRFTNRLLEEGIVESEGTNNDWFGRKWRSAFVKLGFATNNIYYINGKFTPADLAKQKPKLKLQGLEYELTPSGSHLLNADTTGAVHDVFLRQLIRYELPSPIETGYPEGHIKPFIYLLQVLSELYTRKEKGLTKVEIATFLQLFNNHTNELVKQTVNNILEYRIKHNSLSTSREKKEFEFDNLVSSATIGNVKPDTLIDYADTTMRYSQMTGLVTYDGSRLVLRENKLLVIEAVLTNEPSFLMDKNPLEYVYDFYNGTSLPTDNMSFALEEITNLDNEIQSYNKVSSVDIEQISASSDIKEIERIRYKLLEQLSQIREELYAQVQSKDESIKDILNYIEALETTSKSSILGIIDRPAYLEWVIWRGFLAIDHITKPPYLTRNFPIDEDFKPRHTAPGGRSDMIFEFDDYILIVEVTLTTSIRQLVSEGEPVRRHVAQIKENQNKDVYAIFIAPSIDNNVAETFRIGVWYRDDIEDQVNIVPLTMHQFYTLIKTLLNKKYTPHDLQNLMDKCLMHRNIRAPGWKSKIDNETSKWILQIMNT